MLFIGLFMVKPEYQRKGYGKKLFDFILEDFSKRGVKNIGLDALLEQVHRY